MATTETPSRRGVHYRQRPRRRHARSRWNDPRRVPLYVVAGAVVFGLVTLWPEHRDVWYLNDASVHRSMVRWVADRIRAGHLPFDGWYPYLALGASRFHHYQSLPHIITGAASLAFGDATFPWSLYLLLALWPISVYAGGRLLGLGRWPSAAAAAICPLISSLPGLGYEWSSYVWRGSGTWAQLWGMWALPLCLGLSWRAVAKGKQLWLAALALAFTICVHLLTGYLALLCLGVIVLVRPSELLRRLGRAAAVAGVALLAASWMLVPLVRGSQWTINDEFSRGTFYYDSFGARKILGWLFTGRLFDDGRIPALTILVAVGVALSVAAFGKREQARVLLGVGLLSLLLFFGRPTLGPLLKVLPGGGDLFLRRYIMGVHLVGIYLAGLGAVWLAARFTELIRGRRPSLHPVLRAGVVVAAAAVVLAPAVFERVGYEAADWRWIPGQIAAQEADGAGYGALVQRAQAEGPGRIFSERRSPAAARYRLGAVPAYAALLNLQADGVGFTRPTWSLASGAEARFDIGNPALPPLFGVRYVIFPDGWKAPSGAEEIARSGRHVLYEYPNTDYVQLVDTVAPISVNRDDIGQQTASFLDSGLSARGYIPTLAFGAHAAAAPTLRPYQEPADPPGTVRSAFSSPEDGVFGAEVDANRPAVLMVKASFDPGFRALVDDREVPIQMIAPAFVGVPVPPGKHEVVVAYQAFAWYGPLFVIGLGALVLLWATERFLVRRPRKAPVAPASRARRARRVLTRP